MSNGVKVLSADGSLPKEKTAPNMSRIKIDMGYNTLIFLVRHGQSIGNEKREFLGHTDKDLSSLGYEQAARTAEFLAYEDIDEVYSSDLIRAYHTALPHADMRNLKVKALKELREIFAGKWEGMRVEDIISQYPSDFIDGWRANFGTFTIPGGENVQDLAERIYRAIYGIAKQNEGKSILIGCHAAAIRAFWGKLTCIAPQDLADKLPFPMNASVSTVYFDGESLIAGEYSHADHLSDLI
jgi:broad specificity phosphatase PhoE